MHKKLLILVLPLMAILWFLYSNHNSLNDPDAYDEFSDDTFYRTANGHLKWMPGGKFENRLSL